jgi:hypothetical protein
LDTPLGRHRGRLVVALILMIFGAVANPLAALTMRQLVDAAVTEDSEQPPPSAASS